MATKKTGSKGKKNSETTVHKSNKKPNLLAIKQEQFYKGPIPSPDMFKAYEEVLPGSADRILTMSENQSKHRQEMEKIELKSSRFFALLGLCFGFIITISGFGCGVFLIYNNKDASGFAIIIGEISVIIGAFLYKKNKDNK